MTCPASFRTRRQLVAEPDVGTGAAHHDFVITAAGTVGIEFGLLNAVRSKVIGCGAVRRNAASGRDVICRNRIAEVGEGAGAFYIFHGFGVERNIDEIGRVPDIGRLGVPGVDFARRRVDVIPVGVTIENAVIAVLEH